MHGTMLNVRMQTRETSNARHVPWHLRNRTRIFVYGTMTWQGGVITANHVTTLWGTATDRFDLHSACHSVTGGDGRQKAKTKEMEDENNNNE